LSLPGYDLAHSISNKEPHRSVERRKEERVRLRAEFGGAVQVTVSMEVSEISSAGFQAETSFPLQLDSLHEVRLVLGDRAVVVKGRITHCSLIDVDQNGVRYRSGIQLTELPEHVDQALVTFLDAVKDARKSTT
jgi:hypothetical protein